SGHALLDAGRKAVEARIDGIAQLIAGHHVLKAVSEDQAQFSRLAAYAAAQDSAPQQLHAVGVAVGGRVDQNRPFGQRQAAALADLSFEHGHVLQAALQQPAAAKAGGVALGQGPDFDIEMVALLNARPQVGPHQHDFGVWRTEDLLRVLHPALLHLVEQQRLLRRGLRIAARALQPGNQADRFDLIRVEADRHSDVADQLGVGAGHVLFGALRAENRRRRAAGADAQSAEQHAADRKLEKQSPVEVLYVEFEPLLTWHHAAGAPCNKQPRAGPTIGRSARDAQTTPDRAQALGRHEKELKKER